MYLPWDQLWILKEAILEIYSSHPSLPLREAVMEIQKRTGIELTEQILMRILFYLGPHPLFPKIQRKKAKRKKKSQVIREFLPIPDFFE